jgi:hypothetical protein
MRLLKPIGIGLTSLCLLLSLTACDKARVKSLPTPIPEEFVEDCPETPVDIKVNGDLAVKILTLKGDLRYCNADKRAMRAYNRIVGGAAPKKD